MYTEEREREGRREKEESRKREGDQENIQHSFVWQKEKLFDSDFGLRLTDAGQCTKLSCCHGDGIHPTGEVGQKYFPLFPLVDSHLVI